MESIVLYPIRDSVPYLFVLNVSENSDLALDVMGTVTNYGATAIKAVGGVPSEKIEKEIERLKTVREYVKACVFDIYSTEDDSIDLRIGDCSSEEFRNFLVESFTMSQHLFNTDQRSSKLHEFCKKLECHSAVITISNKALLDSHRDKFFHNHLQQSFYELVHFFVGMQLAGWPAQAKE